MSVSIPKPFGRYLYAANNGWEVYVEKTEKGWNWFVKDDQKEFRRFGCYWNAKESALGIALDALEELSGIRDVKATDSAYTYSTFPQIKIWSKKSKWGWSCGKRSGIEKNKKLALEKACQYREDA